MTVSSEIKRADYTGNGSTTDFATQFRFLQNSDVKVILTVTATGVETDQVETTDYTLVGVGLDAGGTVTMIVAPPTGTALTIKRDVALTQGTDYVENDAFPAESHEKALDKLTMITQQIQEELDRSLKLTESNQATDVTVAAAVENSILQWDADGNLRNSTLQQLGSVTVQGNDKRYGPIFATVAAMVAVNPVALDGITVSLVVGMPITIEDYATGNGSGILFGRVVAGATGTADGGSYIDLANGLQFEQNFNLPVSAKAFGLVGNYTADDTSAIDNVLAYTAPLGLTADFGDSVSRYTGTLDLPDGVRIKGHSKANIATFPQQLGDKALLRPGFKHLIPGAVIIFDGTGTLSPETTIRSDRFSTVTPMVKYIGASSPSISGISFIQDMDVLDSGGTLTTGSTDNRASNYTAGFYLATASLTRIFDWTLFGYFDDAGFIIYSGDDLASGLNPDYISTLNCLISGGTAIIGHDTAAGAASQGLTGYRSVDTGHYAYDHHTRADGNFNIPAIFIDGFVTGSIGKIRGHSFTACNVRCLANDAIVLDHADDIQFAAPVWELSILAGVPGADASGGFVGSANTGDLWVFGGAGTTQPRVLDFVNQTGGRWLFAGGGELDGFMVGEGQHGVRLTGGNGDSTVQLTDDFSSVTTGWSIVRDTSEGDELDIRYEGVSKLIVDTEGSIKSPFGLRQGSTRTISAGAISVPTDGNFILVGTEGGAGTDDLTTINGASFAGEMIVLRPSNSTNDVVCKDGTGNLRLAGDFTLTNSQDRIMLMFDGTNWCELSRSDNTA